MSKTIELNGKHYDAITGAPVKIEVKVIHKQKPEVKAVSVPAKRGGSHVKPHKVQSSRTLMRSSVQRPAGHGGSKIHKFGSMEPTYIELPVKNVPSAHKAPPVVAKPITKPDHSNMFEAAIAGATHHADVHAQVRHHKRKVRKHSTHLAAGIAAFLLVAGFAMYQNTPGMQLKIAGLRAGIATASNPDYSVAGFAFKGVSNDGAKRVVALKDANGHRITLSQQKTSWDDDAMLGMISGIEANGEPNYDVVDDGENHLVYRFGNGTATWIRDGVLYQVDDASQLTDDQLQSLAANS